MLLVGRVLSHGLDAPGNRTGWCGPQWFTGLCPVWSTHFSCQSQHGPCPVTACSSLLRAWQLARLSSGCS